MMGWLTALKAGLAAALVIGIYLIGDSAGANRVIARDSKAFTKLAKRIDAETAKLHGVTDTINSIEATRRETMRGIYAELPTVVRGAGYDRPCIDARGLSLFDRARAAANGGDGGPQPAAPGTDGPGADAHD